MLLLIKELVILSLLVDDIYQTRQDLLKVGGALMDLSLYNLHYVMGLFGKLVEAKYYSNIEKILIQVDF